jgi:hypothetical protein
MLGNKSKPPYFIVKHVANYCTSSSSSSSNNDKTTAAMVIVIVMRHMDKADGHEFGQKLPAFSVRCFQPADVHQEYQRTSKRAERLRFGVLTAMNINIT